METKSKFAWRYDAEFKCNAVALIKAGRSLSKVAHDSGFSTGSLGRRVYAADQCHALSEPKTLASETFEPRENPRMRQENGCQGRQWGIFKSRGHCLARERVRHFQLLKTLEAEYQVEELAQTLEVTSSGFYAHQHKTKGVRVQEDQERLTTIQPISQKSRRTWSRPRVWGLAMARGTLRQERRRLPHGAKSVVSAAKTQFFSCSTRSDHVFPIPSSWLAEVPPPVRLDSVWAWDLFKNWSIRTWFNVKLYLLLPIFCVLK